MNSNNACWIYKGAKRDEMYLYVDREDDFERVPPALLSAMGDLELVMSLELSPNRKLARVDVQRVIEELNQQGFYLQMPPVTEPGRE